ncbi:MAG: hypothetical protein AB7I50_06130 [Vicinamibacterales bacterium]
MFDHCRTRLADRAFSIGSAFLIALAWASAATAQESRADTIAQAQAEKARNLEPYRPGRAEEFVIGLKDGFLSSPSGLYPLFGSIYSGGGLAAGAGFRQYYGDNTFFDIKGLYSIRSYKWLEVSTDSIGLSRGRVSLHAAGGWRDLTQVAFYGLGPDTPNEGRVNFGLEERYVEAELDSRPLRLMVFSVGAGYEKYDSKRARGKQPSIEDVFTPDTAPGIGEDPEFLHARGRVGLDWRPASGYARKGGLYQVQYHDYRDRDDRFSFNRLDTELVQHLPIWRERFILSLRGRMESVLDDGDLVPYFLLPSLGSGSTLRGYSSWRFRDRHSMLLQAEWRWTPNRTGLDFAFFYDTGKVTARRADLDFDGLKSDFGIGARFHGPAATPVRIELARSDEGLRLVFGGSAAF